MLAYDKGSTTITPSYFAVGVLTYEMLEGDPPFTGNSEMEVYGKVTRLQYTCAPSFPDLAVDLIERLLRREPENRLVRDSESNNRPFKMPRHACWEHSVTSPHCVLARSHLPVLCCITGEHA